MELRLPDNFVIGGVCEMNRILPFLPASIEA